MGDRDGPAVAGSRAGPEGDGGAGGRVRTVPYDARAVELVAETLWVPVRLAPFRLPGAAVY